MKTKAILLAMLCLAAWLGAQIAVNTDNQILISVNVTGFVAKPGTYLVTPVNRLSDLLLLAGAEVPSIQAPEEMTLQMLQEAARDSLFKNFQALRSVRLVRGGQSRSCDLLKFQRVGDLEQNPVLRDGDVVIVSPLRGSVSLLGEVYLPGEYEYLPGDKLSDLLALAQGFTPGADLKAVSLYRYRANKVDFDVLRLDLRAQDPAEIALQDGDRISVARDSELRRAWKVKVEGNVRAPGEYLVDGTTTLFDLLTFCGGPNSRGDLRNAVLASQAYSAGLDPDFERLKEQTLSTMTLMEYHYLRNKLRQFPGKYSVNIARAWDSQGKEENPVLRDGDYLFVPENMDMVEVSGQVARPGLVPWSEGRNWEYYIEAAGGYTNNRRWQGIRIIRASSGNWVKPSKKISVNPGDIVFVAEKTEREFWEDVKDVLLAATQVVTIFLGIRAITTN